MDLFLRTSTTCYSKAEDCAPQPGRIYQPLRNYTTTGSSVHTQPEGHFTAFSFIHQQQRMPNLMGDVFGPPRVIDPLIPRSKICSSKRHEIRPSNAACAALSAVELRNHVDPVLHSLGTHNVPLIPCARLHHTT